MDLDSKPKTLMMVFYVVGYSVVSSLMAIANKHAVSVFPFPAILTALQYASSAAVVLLLGFFKIVEHDPLTRSKIIDFMPAALVYYVSVWSNTNLLRHANVDTFIAFRSSTPLIVAIAEPIFLGRQWPSWKTFGSLAVILMGALEYVYFDSNFSIVAYTWAVIYVFCISFDMVYIKAVVTSSGLNLWGLVLYNNLLALAFFPVALLAMGEHAEVQSVEWTTLFVPEVLWPVIVSCIFGIGISFFAFACRKALSATSYTVVGVLTKISTVFINVVVWDKHSGLEGVIALLVCIGGGVLYQQSLEKPKIVGNEVASSPAQASQQVEEEKALLERKFLDAQQPSLVEKNIDLEAQSNISKE